MKNPSDILIAGAGVSGLVLALMLAQSGRPFRITLLDRRAELGAVLKPEILQPRALQHLDELGALGALLRSPVQPIEAFDFYRIGGRRLCRADYRLLRHPHPYAVIAFPHITQQVLLEQLRACDNVQVRWRADIREPIYSGSRLVGVKAMTDGGSEEFYASVVVGADGKFSRFREWLKIPHDVHEYADAFVALLLPRPREFGREVRYYLGRRAILGLFPASATSLCALYMVPSASLADPAKQDLERLKAEIRRIDPAVSGALEGVTSWSQVERFACLRVRVDRWAADGAVLLGDAAHAVFPHVAQGSTQAMEDARILTGVLISCFERNAFTAQDLYPYEAVRRGPVAKLQRLADEYVWLWNAANPILARMRDRIFTNIGRNERLMYKTIANEAGLQAEPFTFWERLQALAGLSGAAAGHLGGR